MRGSQKARVDDPRYRRSYLSLLDAVTTLVDSHDVADLSITAVVEAAGVTRPTFYQHFPDIAAAAQRAALRRLDGAFETEEYPPGEGCSPEVLRQRIDRQARFALEHLESHRSFYLRVIEGAATAAFFDEVVRLVAAHLLPDTSTMIARHGTASRQDVADMLAGGTMWLVVRWLRGEFGENAAAMARRLSGISFALVQPYLHEPGDGR